MSAVSSAVKATVENGELVIRLPMNNENSLPLSATGKTFQVASTRGNKATSLVVAGKNVIIGVNAYIPK